MAIRPFTRYHYFIKTPDMAQLRKCHIWYSFCKVWLGESRLSDQPCKHFMMAAHLLYLINQAFLSYILTKSLPFELRINISVEFTFFQILDRFCVFNRTIFVLSGFSGNFCHMIEFSMDTYNVCHFLIGFFFRKRIFHVMIILFSGRFQMCGRIGPGRHQPAHPFDKTAQLEKILQI